ncbi:MAG: hypothetical protein C0597_13020 [Marinilabiliales bacterium]|nr:MAG: hypothetical protein C0597_13020 [Marinilabiliales bacterium]
MTHSKAKKQPQGIILNLIRFFQIALYIPIQIIFIPFAFIGLILGIYKEMRIGKKMGISFSAIKTLQYRWSGHYFNVRLDSLSVAFIKKFPCESHFGLWSILGALVISKRLFGFTPSAIKLVEPEKTFDATAITRLGVFDRIVDKHIHEIEQLVLPGVGFDLIALNYIKNEKIKVFELDQVNTLNVKVDTLRKAGIEHDTISFIPVDYENESWTEKLLEAGFDKSKKTLFLWQSVSLFLEPEMVRDSLRKMADLCSEGSVIAQDFYSKAFLSGEISKMAIKQFKIFEKQGETTKFALEMSEDPELAVGKFLKDCGLKMKEYIQFGKEIGIKPFYCIVEAEKL